MIGEIVGSYQIVALLSVGGMGSVYTATHSLIGRSAAVKMLLPEFSQNRDIVNRFFNEAKATAAIRHPGIVEIFDFGYHASGQAFLVMELLHGEPLSARLARERPAPLSEEISIVLVRSIVGALAAAHARGIVHRDLKPDNIFLVRDPDVPGGERPKLLDFGIAKLADAQNTSNATRTGVVMGTPTYMSPEQCRGSGTVDARADLYAIGCIFYEMVVGRPPFVAEGSGELIAAHMMVKPESPRVRNPAISEALEEIIVRLLEKTPDARYASANELLLALGGAPADERGGVVSHVPVLPTPLGAGHRSQLRSGVKHPSHVGAPAGPQEATTFANGRVAGAQAPTTLSNAAGVAMSPPPAKQRTGVTAGATLATVALGLGIVLIVSRGGGGNATPGVTPATGTPPADVSTSNPVTPPPKPPPEDSKPIAGTTTAPAAIGSGGTGAAGSADAQPPVASGTRPDEITPAPTTPNVKPEDDKQPKPRVVATGAPNDPPRPPRGKPRKPPVTKPVDKPKDPIKPPGLPTLPTEL